ncbi:hypothetical protein EVAR_97658_1 [Eumeta japonica]|uniref:Uncharacterized protein n=1 Tax=Eumeta variegata TaxID=151549 RepID=A0A4C1X0W6_EUMVA|nr:hypothetical protein EVAR_97658_1 [Eumeta japonica]
MRNTARLFVCLMYASQARSINSRGYLQNQHLNSLTGPDQQMRIAQTRKQVISQPISVQLARLLSEVERTILSSFGRHSICWWHFLKPMDGSLGYIHLAGSATYVLDVDRSSYYFNRLVDVLRKRVSRFVDERAPAQPVEPP